MKSVIGIVLGGGKGTRLFPLTQVRSKPAVPLGGKYRLIDIPISNCINSNVHRIYVLTQYNSASLNRHINLTYRFGLFSRGFVDILAAEQTQDSIKWYQGTADAVRQSLRHVLAETPDYILILSGDQLYRMDYSRMMELHENFEADITVSVIPVELEKARAYGILQMSNTGRITDFVEKPEDPAVIDTFKVDHRVWSEWDVTAAKPLMASMGIYLFTTEVLVEALKDESKLDFGRDVIPSALSEYKVFGHIFQGYWEDIGTIRAFYKANMDLATQKPQFNFYNAGAPIYTHPRFLPASRVLNCTVDNSIISDGCLIKKSKIDGSIVGIRSIIGEGSLIQNSMLMGADYYETEHPGSVALGIGDGTSIQGAIIDKNARIGRNVKISNRDQTQEADADNYYIRDGVVIIPKNAVVPDGTEI